jgi:hypothetical protein
MDGVILESWHESCGKATDGASSCDLNGLPSWNLQTDFRIAQSHRLGKGVWLNDQEWTVTGENIMHRFTFALLLGFGLTAPAMADGLSSLFDAQSHDFGNVAIGPTLSHTFTIKNTTNDVLAISNVHVSCGCVSASAQANVIQPGQQTTVYATMDTRRFTGAKSVTIFVDFAQPRRETVNLVVTAFGRTDIAIHPDTLAFGVVRKGSSPTASTQITFLNGMKVADVTCESSYVKMGIQEVKRTGGTGYELTANLRPDLPPGEYYTNVWIKTDQGGNNRILVPLTVKVEAALQATPAVVQFDATPANQKTTKSVVVKGAQPFRILEVKGGEGVFEAVNVDNDTKAVHVVTIAFKPGQEGEVIRTLKILTDMKDDNAVEVKVKGVAR